MQAMARPVYSAICRTRPRASLPSCLCPLASMPSLRRSTFSPLPPRTESPTIPCLQAEDLAPHLGRVKDPAGRVTLGFGVALMHESMESDERALVERVFASGAASVLVVTAPLVGSARRASSPSSWARSTTMREAPDLRIISH